MKKLRMKLVIDSEEFQAIKEGRKWIVRLPRDVFMAALPKKCDGSKIVVCEIAFRARFTNDDFSLVRKVTKVVTGSTGVVGDYIGPIVRIHFTELEGGE